MNHETGERDTNWMRWKDGMDSLDNYIKDAEALLKELEDIREVPMSKENFEELEKHVKEETERVLKNAFPPGGRVEKKMDPVSRKEFIARFEKELVERNVKFAPKAVETIRRLQERCDDISFRIEEKEAMKKELQTQMNLLIQNGKSPVEKLDAVKEQLSVIQDDLQTFQEQHEKKYLEMETLWKDVIEKGIIPMIMDEKAKIENRQGSLRKILDDFVSKTENPNAKFLERILEQQKINIRNQKSPWYSGTNESYFA